MHEIPPLRNTKPARAYSGHYYILWHILLSGRSFAGMHLRSVSYLQHQAAGSPSCFSVQQRRVYRMPHPLAFPLTIQDTPLDNHSQIPLTIPKYGLHRHATQTSTIFSFLHYILKMAEYDIYQPHLHLCFLHQKSSRFHLQFSKKPHLPVRHQVPQVSIL